jgi:putative PIN family toxin of toxin-antitoxin system
MKSALRIIIDTNVLVSALLSWESTPGRAVQLILDENLMLLSGPVLAEIETVLGRRKFSKILSLKTRQEFLKSLRLVGEFVLIASHIQLCRDPRDDKFLELAVDGNADVIVTGDDDLLALDPFGRVRVLTPKQFLEFDGSLGNVART